MGFKGADNSKDKGDKGKPKAKAKNAGMIPKVADPRCKICNCQFRAHLDRLIVAGATLKDVAEFYTDATGDPISTQSVSRHKNKHLDLRQRALRRIVERRRVNLDDETDDAANDLLHRQSMLEAVAADGFNRMMGGEVRYTVGEWLSVVSELDRVENEERVASEDQMRRELAAMVSAIRQVLPEERWDELMRAYQFHLGDAQGELIEAEAKAIEAEVIREEDEQDE